MSRDEHPAGGMPYPRVGMRFRAWCCPCGSTEIAFPAVYADLASRLPPIECGICGLPTAQVRYSAEVEQHLAARGETP